MTDLSTLSINDAALLSEIQTETFTQAYKDVHSADDINLYCELNFSVAKASTVLGSGLYLCKSIHDNGSVAGFYTISFQPCPIELPEKSAELKQIYSLAHSYGTGVGKRLFDDVILELKERSCSWVWLAVSDINFRARSFYEKLGFDELGRGPAFNVGSDQLSSTLLARKV
ncbi:MAG: GNAT family N-acetyltransferase [Pseudomonadota bacterium]